LFSGSGHKKQLSLVELELNDHKNVVEIFEDPAFKKSVVASTAAFKERFHPSQVTDSISV